MVTALKDPTQKFNRDHVDIIRALGMAKEGFDWIWCEHALTVGYRSSLTEIVQIIRTRHSHRPLAGCTEERHNRPDRREPAYLQCHVLRPRGSVGASVP